MSKKVIRLLSVVVMVTMMSTMVFASSFDDVSDDSWYSENVQLLVDKGIIAGFGDGNFGPNQPMTADQFIKTMIVALGHEVTIGEEYWAQPYIDKAIEIGLVQEGEFEVYNQELTRTDMARIAVRSVEALENQPTYQYTAEQIMAQVKDSANITGETAKNYIAHSYELGLILGYDDGEFKPSRSLTRAEACTVIRRVIEASYRKPYEVKETSDFDTSPDEDGVVYVHPDDSLAGIWVAGEYTDYDWMIYIVVDQPLEDQYEKAEIFLLERYDQEFVTEMMDYIKLKKERGDWLPDDYSGYDPNTLTAEEMYEYESSKYWHLEKQDIQAVSGEGSFYVVLRANERR